MAFSADEICDDVCVSGHFTHCSSPSRNAAAAARLSLLHNLIAAVATTVGRQSGAGHTHIFIQSHCLKTENTCPSVYHTCLYFEACMAIGFSCV